MRKPLPVEISCMYLDATRRITRAVESGAITSEDATERFRALGKWLDHRGFCVWPYRECGYAFFRNPRA